MTLGATVLAALTATACGGPPPAAEPADSPAATQRPAGAVSVLDGMPEGLVFDPISRRLYAGLRNPGRLAMIDPASGSTLSLLPLPASPRHLGLAPDGEVLVPTEDADRLIEVSPDGRLKRSVRVGSHPHDAAAAGGRVFVSNEFGDSVSVVRGARVIKTLETPTQPGGLAAAGSGYIAVVAVRDRILTVYDAKNLERIGDTEAGDGPTHAISLSGESVLVADTDGGALLRYRLGPAPELVGRTEVGGAPYGLAFDARRGLVWATLTADNRVEVLRLAGDQLRPLRSYPTVRQPNSVAVDPRTGTAFVAGRSSNSIQRLRPPTSGKAP